MPAQTNSQHNMRLIADLIAPARRILLVTHVAPDGDAVGSLLGLGWLLRDQGKDLTLACEDPVPENAEWLPGSSDIVQRATGAYDLVISLDCSDQRRMGWVYTEDMVALPLINIDHHVTNTRFGSVNWVDPSSVATAQMILSLVDTLEWALNDTVATCLLHGLVTDTQSFRTPNVDAAALQAALRLMEAGACLSDITWRAFGQRSLAAIRLWGQAIDRLQLRDGVLWTEITQAMRQSWALDEDAESGLTNFLAGVREACMVLVFAERDNGIVDVGMRARPGLDVAQVALSLGGGGHPQAAGCTLAGDLAEVKQRVLDRVHRSLAEQAKAGMLRGPGRDPAE
jgi:phosphoesterase RecJ-like protein